MAEKTVTVKASDLEGDDLRHLSVEQVKAIKDTQFGKLSPEQVATFTPEQLNAMSPEQLSALSKEAQVRLPGDQQARIVRGKVSEQLNPQELNLAPGYNPDTSLNQPLREKHPVYAAGMAPQAGASRYAPPAGQGTPDQRIPPENVTMTMAASPGGDMVKEGQPTATPVPSEPDAATVSAAARPEDVGLPRPELRAGMNPLPEEDPTPSIVPIPPPGPRRVA
jgi:hypothetical protein